MVNSCDPVNGQPPSREIAEMCQAGAGAFYSRLEMSATLRREMGSEYQKNG